MVSYNFTTRKEAVGKGLYLLVNNYEKISIWPST
jgi:hypothetical protein